MDPKYLVTRIRYGTLARAQPALLYSRRFAVNERKSGNEPRRCSRINVRDADHPIFANPYRVRMLSFWTLTQALPWVVRCKRESNAEGVRELTFAMRTI